jgi:polysaccharide biosynthesis transport protein
MEPQSRPTRSLRDYWRVLVRRKWVILLGGLAAVVPAALLAYADDPVYESSARILLQSSASDSLFGSSSLGVGTSSRYVANEIQVLEGQIVAERVRQDLGLTSAPPGVDGSSFGDTDVINVTVRSSDPTTARVVADAYVSAYISTKRSQAIGSLVAAGEELQAKIIELQTTIDALGQQIEASSGTDAELLRSQRTTLIDQQAVFKQRLDQLQVDTALSTGAAEVVQAAFQPVEPNGPNPWRVIALALAFGLALGIAAAFLLDYLDDSIRTPEDLAEIAGKRPVLAVVPVNPTADPRPIAYTKPGDMAAESYRTLRTNLLFLGFDGAMRAIQVTSSLPGEGKTTTASNLAVLLAQAGHSVVLVDADLRRPRVHELFDLPVAPGLTSALVSEAGPLPVHLVDTNLSVIPSGLIPPNPSEMLSGRRMTQVMETLTSRFDFVILDSAPVLPVSDAVALSRHADAVVVVAQAERTSRPSIVDTLASLEQVSAPVVGLVLNRVRRDGGEYGYRGYRYSYGYRYRNTASDDAAATTAPPATSNS